MEVRRELFNIILGKLSRYNYLEGALGSFEYNGNLSNYVSNSRFKAESGNWKILSKISFTTSGWQLKKSSLQQHSMYS